MQLKNWVVYIYELDYLCLDFYLNTLPILPNYADQMDPRTAEMQQCARTSRDIILPNNAAMCPCVAERLSTFDRRHINLLKFEYLIT